MTCRIINQMRKEGVREVVPRQSDDDRKNMLEKPVLRLTSTYVTKGAKAMPKAGDRGPWQPRSYYFRDIFNAWFGDIKTGLEWVRGV